MPVYAAGKNRWRVRIWWNGTKKDWIVLGLKSEAKDFEARKRVELEALGPVREVRVSPTFSTFCLNTYRQMAEVELKPSTWKVRRYQLANLDEVVGDLKLTQITNEVVEQYKQKRVRDGRKPATVNNELAILQAVLSYAAHVRVPTARPSFRLLKARGAKGQARVRAWSAIEVRRLLDACAAESPALLPIVLFLSNTGARKGEALALRVKHLDFERGLIRIWPSEEWQPKDGDPREVPMSDALMPWLRSVTTEFVFPAPTTGERWACWPKREFDRARKAAKLVGGPHTLRHTFASHFLQTTPDLFLLARVMGHSDTRVTKLYSHLMPEHLERARNGVNFEAPVGPAALAAKLKWGT